MRDREISIADLIIAQDLPASTPSAERRGCLNRVTVPLRGPWPAQDG